jgi:predicted transcriptional regulator
MSLMSRTVSISLSDELLERLEKFARQTDSRRNAIIVRAIADYLDRHEMESLKAEARRQSLLARARTQPEDEIWPELAAEDSGWT